jgi:hypothetical protein
MTSITTMNSLCGDIYGVILDYLEEGVDQRAWTNTNRTIQNEIMYRSVIKLNPEHGALYYNNTKFRKKLSKYKVSIDMTPIHNRCPYELIVNKMTSAFRLRNLHSLTLSYCDKLVNVKALKNLHTLYIGYCDNLTDISTLGNVHNLSIVECPNVSYDDACAINNHSMWYISYVPFMFF